MIRLSAFFLLLVLAPDVLAEPGSEPLTLMRADGSQIHWYLDRRGQSDRQGVLVLAQGSGCQSPLHGKAMGTAAELAPEMAVVMLEKTGVPARYKPDDGIMDCPESFHAGHTLPGWAADLERVIASLRDEPWWNEQLVLFGGSEGGAMVTLAANVIPETDAVVILSSGLGLSFVDALPELVPPGVADNLQRQIDEVRTNPESTATWGGHSFRYWQDVLDRNFVDDLLTLEIPILLIQGDADASSPVRSARAVYEAFERAGRSNLTYREYAGYDHSMVDAEGNPRLGEVIAQAAAWLENVLADEPGSAAAQDASYDPVPGHGYRIVFNPDQPMELHASLRLPDHPGENGTAVVRGVAWGLESQIHDPRCGDRKLAASGPGQWSVPPCCELLEWSIHLLETRANTADAAQQASRYFPESGWWLVSEPTSLLRVDSPGDSADLPLRIVGLDQWHRQVGATAINGGAWRVPPKGNAPEFYAFGNLELRRFRIDPIEITYVLDDEERVNRLPLAEAHASTLRYLVQVFQVPEDLPEADRRLLVVWLGIDDQIGYAGGAAGSRSFVANYIDGDEKNLDINTARTLTILAHEQVHQLVALLRPAGPPLPVWLSESLAHYYGLKALSQSALPGPVIAMVLDFFIDPDRPVETGLVELGRRHERGDPSAYPQFYSQGATFWSEIDRQLHDHSAGDLALDELIPGLLADVAGDPGLPVEFVALLKNRGGPRIERLLEHYVGD